MRIIARAPFDADQLLDFAEETLEFGSWTWDAGSNLLRWSVGMFRLLGVDPRDRVADFALYNQIIHPEDRLNFNDSPNLVANGWMEERRFRIIRPPGELRWLHNHAQTRHRADGTLAEVVGMVVDVTALRKATRTQIENRALFEAIRKLVGGVIWQTAPDGSVIDELEWWQSIDKMQRPGKGWSRLEAVHPEDVAAVKAAWVEAIETRGIYRSTFRLRGGEDGVHLPVQSVAAAIEGDGGALLGWIGMTVPVVQTAPQPLALPATAIPGAAFRAARTYLGWSAAVFASRAGLSFSTIRRIEADRTETVGELYVQRAHDTLVAQGIRFTLGPGGNPQITLPTMPPSTDDGFEEDRRLSD